MKTLFPLTVLLYTLWLLAANALQAQTTRYVAPTAAGSGNGSSWGNASANLQAVIDASLSGDAVWVAAGTYKPAANPTGCTTCATTRDYAFALKDGVSVYGGFAGTETALAQRNIAANATILSGDIGTATVATDNCYHVVIAAFATTTPTTRLDGFTITRGNANGSGSVTVNAQSLSSDFGGGIYTRNGTNTLTNNTLTGNSAVFYGGGIYIGQSTNTLTNNTLSGNSASTGGGICALNGTNTLNNNTLSGNSASSTGGGIYTENGTNTLTNNALSANSATAGGGIHTENGTNTLTNNTLSGNSASIGGGIRTRNGTNTLTNNLFWGNQQGGSSTVAGADYYAGGASNGNTFKNNLLQLATGNYTNNTATPYGLGAAAAGNLFATDPLFANAADIDGADNLHRTSDDGLRLQVGSPVINMGLNTGAPTTDITGYTRTGTVDIGAYEYNPCAAITGRIYVTTTGTGNGATWATATNNLQAAIDNACGATEIWVAAGIYKPAAIPTGCTTCATARDFAFALKNGVGVYGGFAGIETALGQRNIAANATILSGDIGTVNVATDNCHHVVVAAFATTTPTTHLDGFTITRGNANGSSNITVNSQIFDRTYGGGIYTLYGTNTLANNTLSANSATYGGGIYTANGTNTLTNNTFSGNSAYTGGGIYTQFGTNSLTNNTLSANSAGYNGGGINTFLGSNTLTNNTLSGNSASSSGGGICTDGSSNTLTNNTLSGNIATSNGGGICTVNGANTLTNNILWGNKKGTDATIAGADYCAFGTNGNTFKNNLLQRAEGNYPVSNALNYGIGAAATGNLFATDPLFVDADGADNTVGTTDDDLRLQASSPVRNMGLNSAVTTLPRDIVGNTRTFGGTVDMGAYEQFDLAAFTAVTGISQAVAADGQYTDASGWTHYVNDATDKYILSIKKNGNDIGNIGEGLTVTAYTNGNWSATSAANITPSSNYVTNGGWNVMNRWWDVTPASQPTTDVQVRSYYTQADLDGLKTATNDNALTRTQLRFYKINDPAVGGPYAVNPTSNHSGIPAAVSYADPGYWEYTNAASASTTTWADGTVSGGFYAEYTVRKFSGGGGGGAPGGGGAFPVEFTDINAYWTNPGSEAWVEWHTASELNTSHFALDRSTDGTAWNEAATTPATGAGSYTLPDAPGTSAVTYYRIRAIDHDGQVTTSPTAELHHDGAIAVAVWPNPARETLHLAAAAGTPYSLSDPAGRVLLQGSLTTDHAEITTAGLPAGVYVVRLGSTQVRVVVE